jgi:rare lipoprotein A
MTRAMLRSGAVLSAVISTLLLGTGLPGDGARADEAGIPEARFTEVGTASWYGPGFHGRQTASGEIYDQNAMTAAHRTLPLGTVARVTNTDNGRSVVVLINDRGPYIRGRVIDVSKGVARRLGMIDDGLVKVQIEILRGPETRIAKGDGDSRAVAAVPTF